MNQQQVPVLVHHSILHEELIPCVYGIYYSLFVDLTESNLQIPGLKEKGSHLCSTEAKESPPPFFALAQLSSVLSFFSPVWWGIPPSCIIL